MATPSSLQTLKVNSTAKDDEEKLKVRRKRGAIVLTLDFLVSNGYSQAAQALQSESGISLTKFCIADNVSLPTVMSQFEEYHQHRFGATPKFFRALEVGEGVPTLGVGRGGGGEATRTRSTGTVGTVAVAKTPDAAVGVTGVALNGRRGVPAAVNAFPKDDEESLISRAKLLKPLPKYPTDDLTELSHVIQRDILEQNPNVYWDDIVAHDGAKTLLKESVVLPLKYPSLFTGLLRPWRGVLLFGPPGTGKTMLAKAVATECKTTFFNISASTIVSKWRGDSEKLVRMLFELAQYYAPSTIFMDEIDSVMSKRTSDGSEHEGSRRMKTELLIQMDGLARRTDTQVFVLAASNHPWDLDGALLRRLEKRIVVHLPPIPAREALFRKHLYPKYDGGGVDYVALAEATEGYSGADIEVVCREALMQRLRLIMAKMDLSGTMMNDHAQSLLMKVNQNDVMQAVGCTKSTCRSIDPRLYVKWEKEFGSGLTVEE